MELLDPSPVLMGGAPDLVSSGTVASNGAFTLSDIPVELRANH